MKAAGCLVGLLLFMLSAQGCYTPPQQARMTISEIRFVQPGSSPPTQEMADLIIYAHIKKRLSGPRTEQTPYTYSIAIDGHEFKETVKGVRETLSVMPEERGEGIHYEFAERVRLDPGVHSVALRTEEGRSATVDVELKGGTVHAVRFEPVYRAISRKFGFPQSFRHGLIGFGIYLNGKKVKYEGR